VPLQPHMDLISVDDHVIEHPRVWQDRLPAKFLERGPRIVESTEVTYDGYNQPVAPGQQVWQFDGDKYPQIGLNAVAGRPPEEFGLEPLRFDEMRKGCYDPVERLRDMDEGGIAGSLCFPNFPRFAGAMFVKSAERDDELAMACLQAYNDFILDEWTAADPNRLIPMVMLPLWDQKASMDELRRTAARGARAITFPENPTPLGLPSFHSDHWDPLFSLVEETETTLAMHFGSSGVRPYVSPDAPRIVSITLMGTNSMNTLVEMLVSPMFHRHPNLKVALSEGGIGWLPYVLERLEDAWTVHRFYLDIDQHTPPTELFKDHVFGCFIQDHHGLDSRDKIGVEQIMWECDYPHSDSTWPNARKSAEEMLLNVPDDEAHKIAELNARKLYRLPRVNAGTAAIG
jgi:predicted TIM-barrel fold metal-dependent hydrolase